MAHGVGPGGFGGHGGPGFGGHGGPGFGGPGFGHGGFGPGGHFGLHSGGPPGFIGRGGYSQGHYNQSAPQTKDTTPKLVQGSRHSAPTETSTDQSTLVHSDQRSRSAKHSPSSPQEKNVPKRTTRHLFNTITSWDDPDKTPQKAESTEEPELHEGATKGLSVFLTRKSTLHAALILAILSLILSCSMCMSNILATKIWAIGPIVLDGGFILFPLTYVITDILVELYYRKIANLIVLCCCLVNLVAFFALQCTALLPAAPGVMQVEPSEVLGLSSRVMIASAIAIIISTIVNNRIYDYMRRYKSKHAVSKRAIERRAWVSSFFAHMPDTALFTIIAFSGYSTLPALLHQMITSYLSALAVETLLLPLTGNVAYSLRRSLTNLQD